MNSSLHRLQDRPGYTNHFQGNLVVRVVNNDHLVWVPSYGGVTSVAILTRAWMRETSVAAAKLLTFTAVVCNIEVSPTGSTCRRKWRTRARSDRTRPQERSRSRL